MCFMGSLYRSKTNLFAEVNQVWMFFTGEQCLPHFLGDRKYTDNEKKGNMRVNESLRQREQGGGEAGKEDLGDAEVGRVWETSCDWGREYKIPTSRCQRHFLSRPAVSLHISSFNSLSVVPELLLKMNFSKSSMQQIPSNRISFTRSTPQHRAASVFGGAGGHGARISSASVSSLRSGAPMTSSSSFKLSSGMGPGFGSASKTAGSSVIMGNERGAMQNLNDRLANYLETVRNLEQANKDLEVKIREALEKGGPDMRDYSKYEPIIDDLRRQVSKTLDNDHWNKQAKAEFEKMWEIRVFKCLTLTWECISGCLWWHSSSITENISVQIYSWQWDPSGYVLFIQWLRGLTQAQFPLCMIRFLATEWRVWLLNSNPPP